MTKRTLWAVLLLVVAMGTNRAWAQGISTSLQKLQVAELAINALYVDEVDEEALVENAIRGMLKSLDPHSSYTTAKETQAMNESLQGSFEGIGVQFNVSQDTLLVIQTIAGGPSEKVGILAGDRIVAANDTAIAGVKMSRETMVSKLRGKKGTWVDLKVVRRGIADTLVFSVKRDKIPMETLDAAYMITPTTGYVRIGSFGATTHGEFITAVDSLQRQGMRDIIIDLQENGGGYLQAAILIANEFLQKGDMIVYTEGRSMPRAEHKADGRGALQDCGVMVLINEYSASASEIVAGAIQDQDRGTVVGRRSFGKGLVQRPIEFSDGSMIKLTTAHYYTPAGRCIQKPYEKGETEEYYLDIEKRFRHGELYSVDSIQFVDSLRCYTLKEQRAVYGGGGIMPDVFVPLDTLQYTRYHRQLAARGVIIGETLRYVDANRKALLKEYSDVRDFDKRYKVPEELLQAVYDEATTLGVEPVDEAEREQSAPRIANQLKALVARDLWDMSAYFLISNRENRIVSQALETLAQEKTKP